MNRERTGPTGHIHADIGIIFVSPTRELFFLQKQQSFFAPAIIFLAYQNNFFVKVITFAKNQHTLYLVIPGKC